MSMPGNKETDKVIREASKSPAALSKRGKEAEMRADRPILV
ncbi:hypothetical protein ACETRX_25605 [Labrys portucalensis]|uniref:Uncharacterized protein n=1 Tax=Labrys neptuniae TaxID=376174 RepID=A0ABV6ZLI8_9HYPH|nr:hypothetical protein [Labrys neptuniae]MDT3380337.1 hypothetical protein [Labrys neptuniae]